MYQLIIVLHLSIFFIFSVEAQFNSVEVERPTQDAGETNNFQPSLAVVIGILCIMFSLTFILLIYAKFCHRGSTVHGDSQNINPDQLVRSGSTYSGIDKTVIESLPFFKFSSLKGSKKGLECAVCLSKFEDIEVLRLLPKCKHAFHIDCVDQWLEKHSSCPLCRCKVSSEDAKIIAFSNSLRFLTNYQSEAREDSDIELFVQREESDNRRGSSRFSIGSSFRKTEKLDEDEAILIQEQEDKYSDDDDDKQDLHKFNHKIIISDFVLKNRWSNVSSSDLLFLNSEMIQDLSSNRFSCLESENERFAVHESEQKMKNCNPSTSSDHSNKISNQDSSNIIENQACERRSVSEITGLSRFRNSNINNSISGENNYDREDYRVRKLWLPIARRTVQWFASRERSEQTMNTRQTLNV
ncbi:E3 ubiquitin-protein ligase ATL42-like [Mercurialis annua]|uniref:E3 ubiquitin-protein ligase ATL42-like n=1 Tax=Mercurialis annua TaxID=3986 RepID=UPI00215E56E3|nr:E3 ubiquitin-protein ligase ATL42-like [Mercurialis annua]